MQGKESTYSGLELDIFRESVCDFSLGLQEIRPSAVFGARRKAALRGKSFAWVQNLRSLDKLREVGVSPYLGYSLFKYHVNISVG